MTTALFTHSACFEHDPGRHHPESPARLKAVLNALEAEEFALLDRREAPRAELEQVARAHPPRFVERTLGAVPQAGHAALDGDTIISPGSGEAALRAAGAVCAAVDAVMTREARNAFCAVRPPGHHAEPEIAMGFCMFNNVAIGAYQARARHGIRRVAVMDFDVHHGNGTQAMFWGDPELFYASTHQFPLYPGTGSREERGAHNNIVNVPLPPMSDGVRFREQFLAHIAPAMRAFKPELVMISAGFDAHESDPLASLRLRTPDYAWATAELVKIANEHCQGRVVSTLEGGYDLHALADASAAHVRTLMTT
ncbi:MAG: histone deacetylase family protein [Alphaproteobacteria bacterium]|nr:histone deacetylase family protein [Alphaproteobacteria bacterium]